MLLTPVQKLINDDDRQVGEFIESMGQFWPTGADVGRVNACYPDVNNARDIPDYTQAFFQWVREYYLQTGDCAFLAANYTALTNIAQYVNRSLNPTNGLITRLLGGTSRNYRNGIIDCPPDMRFGYDMATVAGPGNASAVINAWAWEDYNVISRIAGELGNTGDSNTYRRLANALQTPINTHLLNASGIYVDGLEPGGTQSAHASQHANAFPPSLRGTAAWESWTANTDGDSESHGWGVVGLDGYIRYILGVKALAPQFAQVQIVPLDFGTSLACARGSLLTDRGTIAVESDRNATLYHLAVTIPVNVTAIVYVPQAGGTNTTITVDGTKVSGTLTNGATIVFRVNRTLISERFAKDSSATGVQRDPRRKERSLQNVHLWNLVFRVGDGSRHGRFGHCSRAADRYPLGPDHFPHAATAARDRLEADRDGLLPAGLRSGRDGQKSSRSGPGPGRQIFRLPSLSGAGT
ncbi:MAG: alpha-L-rhamnosidase C-terminal domain-containing protein [Tepidisphaeraceae bacterium]|jgi:alpha-L-rhamnosidase